MKTQQFVEIDQYPVTNKQLEQLSKDEREEIGFDVEVNSGKVKLRISNLDVLQRSSSLLVNPQFEELYR